MLLETIRMILLLLVLISGVYPMTSKEIYVKAGDLVMLNCGDYQHDGTVMLWKMETDWKMHLYSNMSVSEHQQLGLVVYQKSLLILNASENHQGNYSCGPFRNFRSQMFFRLTVCPKQSKECNFRNRYNQICYTNQACTLHCPEGGIPSGIPSIETTGPKWHKENGELSKANFPSVAFEDSGVYICTWSFLYSDQIFNTSLTVVLNIQKGTSPQTLGISLPKNGQVFAVELGKPAMITCIAVIDSCHGSLFWLRENVFLNNNDTLRYFYNSTCSGNTDKEKSYWIISSLVLKEVLEEDLSTEFICKLENNILTDFVTITLTKTGISSPKNGRVFEVEFGKPAVITCIAVVYVCDDSLFWLSKGDFIENNETFRYFYNSTCSGNADETFYRMNSSLVFREVLEEDFSTEFTCKLESAELTDFVTITLNKTADPSYVMLTVCTVCIVVVMAVIVVTYMKFKIDVTLFLRDKLGFKVCTSNTSDGKSYDAFLMCYQSDIDGGLSEEDRKFLASTLEDQFGYSLCLYDRDVLPGQAVAEAVLDCVEQSRAVLLVPSFPDPEPGSGVLSAIHASLVERKTRLIFINTEQMEASRSGSFPEALQLLSKARYSVTLKSWPPSSSFWKQLRYHLPAPLQIPNMRLLTQE